MDGLTRVHLLRRVLLVALENLVGLQHILAIGLASVVVVVAAPLLDRY